MSKIKIDDTENSLDNSGDGEIIGMVGDGTYDSVDNKQNLMNPLYLDNNEDETYFRDLEGGVTYKFVQMGGCDDMNNIQNIDNNSQQGQFFVISNQSEILGPSPKKIIRKEEILTKAVTAKKRDEKRRATHNEVERRRRDKINTWISQLASLIPETSNHPCDTQSKGGILAKACDYIMDMNDTFARLEKVQAEKEKLSAEVSKLNQEVALLRKENALLKSEIDSTSPRRHKPDKS